MHITVPNINQGKQPYFMTYFCLLSLNTASGVK